MLEDAFLADRGFEVPTIAYTLAELQAIGADADEVAEELGDPVSAHYVTLLKDEPAKSLAAEIEALEYDGELARVRGRAVHLVAREALQRGKAVQRPDREGARRGHHPQRDRDPRASSRSGARPA